MRIDEEKIGEAYTKELVLVKLEKHKTTRVYHFKDDEDNDYIHYQVSLANITTKNKPAICAARRWIKFYNDSNIGRRVKCVVINREMGGDYVGSFGQTIVYRNVESFSGDCIIQNH